MKDTGELTVELRTDHNITSSNTVPVGPEEAQKLHAWPESYPEPDEPITWAVMDSGIHAEAVAEHPWFEGVDVVDRYDATGEGAGDDNVGHGTACAGIIAHNTPAVELIDVRIFGNEGRTGIGVILDAYNWLTENADRIDGVNMSWGSSQDSAQLNRLHRRLLDAGVVDVVAAGNTGTDGGSPATEERAFSAGAVDREGDPTRFSSFDPDQGNPDVAAIGKDVLLARAPGTAMGTVVNDELVMASGTSFAAPYTSAAYITALYKERMDWDDEIMDAAPDIPGTPKDGGGLLKLAPLLDDEPSEPDPRPNPEVDATVYRLFGSDIAVMPSGHLPVGGTTVEVTADTDEHVELRFKK